jgi:hypothetical protein
MCAKDEHNINFIEMTVGRIQPKCTIMRTSFRNPPCVKGQVALRQEGHGINVRAT